MNRREFLAATAALAAGSNMLSAQDKILSRIKPPTFPKRDFDITKYGAASGGEKDCTGAISKAITACAAAGGGRVVIPAGVFLTGAVRLESNVELHVAEGATLRFSRDPKQYLPVVLTRWEGTECMNYSPFIYAFEKTNIAITGAGTLNGQADSAHWWDFRRNHDNDRKALMSMGDKGVPVKDRRLRPGFLHRYAHREMHVQHRRRLHCNQIRTKRRRPAR